MAKKSELTEIQKRALKIAKETTSGCPLMEGREKAEIEDFVNEELTIVDAYPMTGDNGRYYCVTIDADDTIFILSGGGLTKVLENIFVAFDEDIDTFREGVRDITFRFEKMKKTKNGRSFRPVTIL